MFGVYIILGQIKNLVSLQDEITSRFLIERKH